MASHVLYNAVVKATDQLSVNETIALEDMRAREREQAQVRERKAAALALLKRKAQHDPIVEAMLVVLGHA